LKQRTIKHYFEENEELTSKTWNDLVNNAYKKQHIPIALYRSRDGAQYVSLNPEPDTNLNDLDKVIEFHRDA